MGLSLSSCLEDQCEATLVYTRYDPFYVTNAEIRQPIELRGARDLENPGKIELELIEVQSGSYLGEDDIVRYEDDYRRD